MGKCVEGLLSIMEMLMAVQRGGLKADGCMNG